MIWLYRILYLPALLLAAPYYLWRMRRRGGYRGSLAQRLGAVPDLPAKKPGVQRVWLHAVSVGELLAAGPLLEALGREPGVEVYLTTTTSTARTIALEKYAAHIIGLGYFPLDWWPCSVRAWRALRPDLCVLLEGERWPEHVHQAALRRVPVLAVNARLSDRSFRRSLRFGDLVRPLSKGVTQILCAAKEDEQRFRALGFPAAKLAVTGNLKLDVDIPLLGDAEKTALRRELGLPTEGLILLGSSTWAGEERALLEALESARARALNVSLLLVPRHAERREELRTMLGRTSYRFHFRSEGMATKGVDVVVADTTGELRRLTQLADVAFVGKSLAPHEGGQTPVEAALLGKPVLHGPRMSNFRDIMRTLTVTGATRQVETHSDLVSAAAELLADAAARERMSRAALAWAQLNRGAAARTMAAIRAALPSRHE